MWTAMHGDPIRMLFSGTSATAKSAIVPVSEAPKSSVQVLATCHSLAIVTEEGGPSSGGGSMIGDPLEKATLNALGWNLTKAQWITFEFGRFLE